MHALYLRLLPLSDIIDYIRDLLSALRESSADEALIQLSASNGHFTTESPKVDSRYDTTGRFCVIVPPCGLSLQEPLSSNNPREHGDSLSSLEALVILEPTTIYSLSSARSLRAPHDMGAPYTCRALWHTLVHSQHGTGQ
jgi:hypothetical protein